MSSRKSKRRRRLMLVYALTVIFIGAMSYGLKSIDDKGGRAPVALNCNINNLESGLEITNNDSFDYLNARIVVNDNKVIVNDIIAGEKLFIPKKDMKLNTGSIVSKTLDVNAVTIICNLSAGVRGYYHMMCN